MEWDEYIGQEKLKERLKIHIESAVKRRKMLDHILLSAPPGYGKTAIARLIGKQMMTQTCEIICPVDDKIINRVVSAFQGVWVLDEFHNLSKRQQESFLPLLQEGYLQTKTGEKIPSSNLCVVGATTEPDKVITPLYDRFKIKPHFEEYTDDQMAQIVRLQMERHNIFVSDEVALKLALATGGVPRLAEDIAVMARDLRSTDPEEILRVMRLTEDGLGVDHISYINLVARNGGVAGLNLISSQLRLPPGTIQDIERLLVKRGYIDYTKQGRSLKGKAYSRFNIEFQ